MTSKRGNNLASGSDQKRARKAKDITLTKANIQKLEAETKKSPKYFNNIARLLQHLNNLIYEIEGNESLDDEKLESMQSLVASLTRIFTWLLSKKQLQLRGSDTKQQQIVSGWLQAKYSEYFDSIFKIWEYSNNKDFVAQFQIYGLSSVMNIVKAESKYMAPGEDEPFFATNTYDRVVRALIISGDKQNIRGSDYGIDNPLILEFYKQYFNAFWDVKYYFFRQLKMSLAQVLKDREDKFDMVLANLITLVKISEMYPRMDADSYTDTTLVQDVPQKVSDLSTFRSNFEKSWIILLQSKELSVDQYKAILFILHKRVIPFMNNPTKLMDFLTDSYNLGIEGRDISLSIVALNGLWELIKKFNLDYPDFYTKLYCILTPELLHLNIRSRFLRMLDLFMTSTHLSATIVASFIKRLSQLALRSPAPGIIAIIPFVYNLLKRHPTCMLLIHNIEASKEKYYVDPFNPDEKDPAKTNALDSSLWELETMMNHYHPQVASLAKILSQPFSKNNYNIEDFLDWSYQRLLEGELKKKVRSEIDLEFETWDRLYGEGGFMEDYQY